MSDRGVDLGAVAVSFYHPGEWSLEDDFSLTVGWSGYGESSHFTGEARIAADDPDYLLYWWLIRVRNYDKLVADRPGFGTNPTLDDLRSEFAEHHRQHPDSPPNRRDLIAFRRHMLGSG